MATLQITDNRPSGDSHADGKAYFETSTNKMLVWNATAGAWVELDPDGTGAVTFENRWGASFDGSNDSFAFTGSADIQLDQTYTACSWFKVNTLSPSTTPRGLITWGSAATGKGRGIYLMGSAVGAFAYGGGANTNASTIISAGVWYHVAVTFNGSTTNVYINGGLDRTRSNTLPAMSYTKTHIGELYYSQSDTDRHFDGYIDELALFNTALSAEDITKIYNGGIPTNLTLAASYDTDRTSNLKGYWRMGDDSNDSPSSDPTSNSIATITDSSGNGNDATQSDTASQPTFADLTGATIYS
jgi:hypothetical protein